MLKIYTYVHGDIIIFDKRKDYMYIAHLFINRSGRKQASEIELWKRITGKVEFDFLPCPSCLTICIRDPTWKSIRASFLISALTIFHGAGNG